MTESKLWPALIRARQAIQPIAKTATNPHFRNSYAPLGEVLAAVLPALHAEGLALTGAVIAGPALAVHIVHSESGEQVGSDVPLVGAADMQKLGGAMTYAMRYAVGMLLALELDEDDDGNKAAVQPPKAAQASPQAAPAPRPSNPSASSQGKGGRHGGKERPAPMAQDDDPEAVAFMAEQLDAHAAEEGNDFRIVKADGKLGVYGKVAGIACVEPGTYSLAQLGSRGALPKLRKFYTYLCEKNDLAVYPAVARHEAPADIHDLTSEEELPF